MMRHVFTVPCSQVSVDQESNSLSMFETIFGGPGRHEWEVYFRTADDEDWTLATRIPFDLDGHIEPEEEESSTIDAEVTNEDG